MNTSAWQRRHRLKSIVYTGLVYLILLLSLFGYSTSTIDSPTFYEDAIQVNLGDVESAYGETVSTSYATAQSSAMARKTIENPSASSQSGISSEITDASPDISAQIAKEAANSEVPDKLISELVPQKKPIALLRPGIADNGDEKSWKDSYGEEKSSQGVGQGEGDMGSTYGSSSSTNYGTSVSIVSGLGNRSLNALPRINESFDYEGIVLIKVLFRQDGKAISAIQDIRNSTTTKKQLVDIALLHAKKITLNRDTNAPFQQAVTFRFIFKLRL